MTKGIKIESAEIIAIGTELLLGQTLDSNSHYLARKLSDLGINCFRKQVVGDHHERIKKAICLALEDSDLVITTGGLGASEDDITVQVVADLLDLNLVEDLAVNRAIRDLYPQANKDNFIMPRVPEGSKAFPNHNGTAPASFTSFSYKGKTRHILILPGPPVENIPIFEEQVLPWLRQFSPAQFIHRYVRLVGIGEYSIENRIRDIIDSQTNPTIAPYAGEAQVLLRITQRLEGEEDEDRTEEIISIIKERLDEYIYEIGPRSLEEVVIDQLKAKKMTCAFAESCTAGLAAAHLASVAGASKVLMGGIVSYSNTVKENILGVQPDIIEQYGAVSEECARSMANNCKRLFNADLNLSITGFAGPAGGTKENPVGTVYFGLANREDTVVYKKHFSGNRQRIQNFAVVSALDLLRRNSK